MSFFIDRETKTHMKPQKFKNGKGNHKQKEQSWRLHTI
jgi:hypothetical protein